jgi:hypothetical protein
MHHSHAPGQTAEASLLWCKLIWVNSTVVMPTLLRTWPGLELSPPLPFATDPEQAYCNLLELIAHPEVLRHCGH